MRAGFERYSRSTNAFSQDEVLEIQKKKVCIVGCGGLGGHVIETLARFGVLSLTLVDGDVFSVSNLNRQVFATEKNLGINKAEATKDALRDINSEVMVSVFPEMLSSENAAALFAGHDLVMDCLDNSESRHNLHDACNAIGIPSIHGAIAGFYGQIATMCPGDNTFRMICAGDDGKRGLEKNLGNPPFMPQAVAAIQCSEALKLLCGKKSLLRKSVLYIDLLHNDFEVIRLTD